MFVNDLIRLLKGNCGLDSWIDSLVSRAGIDERYCSPLHLQTGIEYGDIILAFL